MIEIVSYTKYNNEVFFFVQNKNKALTVQEAEVLVNNGLTNLSKERFARIIGQGRCEMLKFRNHKKAQKVILRCGCMITTIIDGKMEAQYEL